MTVTLSIGRNPDANTVVASDSTVSSAHATLTLRAGLPPLLQDIGSTNGTFVNGRRVNSHHLLPNDSVHFGNWEWNWHLLLGADGRLHPNAQPIVVGRSVGSGILLNHSSVSGTHARVYPFADGTWLLVDCASTNGTFASNNRVKAVRLQPGTTVRLGAYDWDWQPALKHWAPPAVAGASPAIAPVPPVRAKQPNKPGQSWLALMGIWAALAAVGVGLVMLLQSNSLQHTPNYPTPSPDPYATDTEAIDPQHTLSAVDLLRLDMSCGRGEDFARYYRACNYTHTAVRNLAVELASRSPGEFSVSQVCHIYDQCYKNWSYVNDPATQEYLSTASNSIRVQFKGDCDDYAVLMASLVMAVGGHSRVCLAYGPEGGHAFCEVMVGLDTRDNRQRILQEIRSLYPSARAFNCQSDDLGRLWLNLDWTASCPGGPYFNYTRGWYYNLSELECGRLR